MRLANSLRGALPPVLLLLAFSAPAFAQSGINLSWNDCGSFGTSARNFACDTNAGQQVLVASAVPGVDMPQFDGMEAEVIIQTRLDVPNLTPWWQLASGGCRFGALTTSADFTSGPFNCADTWGFGAAGGMLYEPGYTLPNRARLRVIYALAQPTPIAANSEYYMFKVVISNAKTVGTGACTGCANLVCLVLTTIKLVQPTGVGDVLLSQPAFNQVANWQPANGGICFGDAARTSTWGQVKSLYR